MLEIVSPAGSPEGVTAAVQNGADAVYMGYPAFNARRGAKNFTPDAFARAAEYCRVRGVSAYLALNALVSDGELPEAVDAAVAGARAGADAIIVSDLGLLRALRNALPGMPLHFGTKLNIHNLSGVRIAAAMGATRVTLAKELTLSELREIAGGAEIDLEVTVHGGSCMSYGGQCYFSAAANRNSANRGSCAQMCRRQYSTGSRKTDYPLSLRDTCLISHVETLKKLGVKALRIEGRLRRPEYTAVTTGLYARAVRDRRDPTDDELRVLTEAFSQRGLTDGFFSGKTGERMLSLGEGAAPADHRVFHTARKNYLSGEYQRVPVRFAAELKKDSETKLIAADDRKNAVVVTGKTPEEAFHRVTDAVAVSTALHKTEGTPFYCAGVKSTVDPGLVLAPEELARMRREALAQLLEKRKPPAVPVVREYAPELSDSGVTQPPVLTVSVLRASQLSDGLLEQKPHLIYIPVAELKHVKRLRPFTESPDITIAAALPRALSDSEWERTLDILGAARKIGIREILVSNIGHILPLRERGFTVRGDYGLNIYSSYSLAAARDLGLRSAALSMELDLDMLRRMAKPIDTELIAYGRLPFMYTENCVIRASLGVCACEGFSGITDRDGANYPVLRECAEACRNVVYSPRKLFLADRLADFNGVWGLRLAFSTENAEECADVLRRYRGNGRYEPGGITRGLYYKGVR